jgi:hypothetical protein
MSSSAKGTLRVFGGLHIAMAMSGFAVVAVRMAKISQDLGSARNASQFVAFLLAETAVSLLCLVLLSGAGLALLRSDPRGVRRSNVVLLLEVIWVFVVAVAFCSLFEAGGRWRSLALSELIAGGISGMSPQFLTGYPFVALIAINLANRSRRRAGGDNFSPARQAEALLRPGAAVTSPGETATGARRQETNSWSRRVLRTFGALHIVMALFGVMVVASHLSGLPEELALHPAPPHFLAFFPAVTAVSLLCLLMLGTAGVALVRADPRGVGWSNAALLLEIAWLTATVLAGYVMLVAGGPWRSPGMTEMRAAMEGNLGLAPQAYTGYPLVALIAVNLANRRLRRISAA